MESDLRNRLKPLSISPNLPIPIKLTTYPSQEGSMKIDGSNSVSTFEKSDKKVKKDQVREYGLNDFLPKHSKSKSTTIIDRVDLSASTVSQSLGITSQQIADKIKEVMGKEYPGYEASFAPEDNTSEKISNNIVQGATALFGIYASQNKNLQGEELINSFMSVIRGGVEKGLGDAKKILGDLGALKVSGVEDAISETMRLVEVGFKNFESQYRKDNGLPALAEEAKSEKAPTQNNVAVSISQQA